MPHPEEMEKKNFEDEILRALAGLSEAVGDGFRRVDKTLADHGGRFDALDRDVGGLREKLDRIETLILKDHLTRIERLEERIGINR